MLSTDRLHWSRHLSRQSFWHRTDPRIRLLVSMVLSMLALATRGPADFLVLYLLIVLLYSLSGSGIATAWSGFRPFLFLFLFTAVFQVFFTPGTSLPGLESSRITVTVEGVQLALTILLRLAAVILLSTNLVTTTSPLDLARGTAWFLLPLRKLGLPVGDLVLILHLGFQFFPVLLEESQSLRAALESRGISIHHPVLALRLRALMAWVLSLLTTVMERSQRLAIALEVKNFGGAKNVRLRFPRRAPESVWAIALCSFGVVVWMHVH
jgi:energy-coupling factor transport system permease protein